MGRKSTQQISIRSHIHIPIPKEQELDLYLKFAAIYVNYDKKLQEKNETGDKQAQCATAI
ncbi:hypothetical protein [Desulforamulus putei]|uniref:hypothetical protein n=1 Tax=Desulforamulus putei TaxID=74701 RepID=UPI0009327E34|nr:hypothetical protein [Desulforamulus putei]